MKVIGNNFSGFVLRIGARLPKSASDDGWTTMPLMFGTRIISLFTSLHTLMSYLYMPCLSKFWCR